MNRRAFFQLFAAPRNDRSAQRPDPSAIERHFDRVPTAGSPRQYRRGACVLVEDVQAWLCRDDGGFYALEAQCPDSECLVSPTENGFVCPCHRNRFNAVGELESGSAARGLRFFYLDLDARGHLRIDRDHDVDPRDRFMA
ncbi:MAG: Rieske 2Fe-2S domain-containing protein [Chloroflexi bacterium]|nr:Rieske 2Fe-2S domain-containing protein [Chloroflexota bacterium]